MLIPSRTPTKDSVSSRFKTLSSVTYEPHYGFSSPQYLRSSSSLARTWRTCYWFGLRHEREKSRCGRHSERTGASSSSSSFLPTKLVRGTSLNQPTKDVNHALVTSGVGIPTGGAILGKLD